MKVVAVHSGHFHADEVFAVATLRLLYPKIRVVRTRDPKEYNKADLRVDVGGKYEPHSGDFDHHQKEGAGKRDDDIPYASAGLIWKHFGMRLVSSKDAWELVDKRIMRYIDAVDSGVKTYKSGLADPYDITSVIDTFNPFWEENENDYDNRFDQALSFAVLILKNEIAAAELIVKAKAKVKRLIAAAKKAQKRYIVLGNRIPWQEVVVDESDLLYVIFNNGERWTIRAVPVERGSFKCRKPFPKRWAAMRDKGFEKLTKVEGALFCHKNLFICGAKTKDAAIKLTELAIKDRS